MLGLPVLLHTGDASAIGVLPPEWLPLVGIGVAAVAYTVGLLAARRQGRPGPGVDRAAAFYLGLLILALALGQPLDGWSDASFAAHMLQHLLLMLVVAPLLVLGRPGLVLLQALPPRQSGRLLRAILRPRAMRRLVPLLVAPWLVAVAFNGTLVLWHLPDAFDAALRVPAMHQLEHIMFFTTSLLFWWVVLDPTTHQHKASPHAVLGLAFIAYLVCDLIAATLTLATRVLYPYYLSAANPWGMTPLQDQRLGGAMMWLSGGVYFILLFWTLWRVVHRPATVTA